MLNGDPVTVAISGNTYTLNGNSQIQVFDIEATNGIIHVIDTVLTPPTPRASQNIAAIVDTDSRFSTLDTALEAANLTSTFTGTGPFTVFAPTNDAFNKLGSAAITSLLSDIPTLTNILQYHVVSGQSIERDDLSNGASVTMLNGDQVSVTVSRDSVVLNSLVAVTIFDIEATNGVIHVIDTVLTPPSDDVASQSIAAIVESDSRFSALETSLATANLTSTLGGVGPFTVFAPTDDAFNKLGSAAIASLLADVPTLTGVLTYHVASGVIRRSALTNGASVTMLNGQNITVTINGTLVFVNDLVQITSFDVEATNGIIHIIDTVLSVPTTTTRHATNLFLGDASSDCVDYCSGGPSATTTTLRGRHERTATKGARTDCDCSATEKALADAETCKKLHPCGGTGAFLHYHYRGECLHGCYPVTSVEKLLKSKRDYECGPCPP